MYYFYVAGWSSGSLTGSYPGGRRFDPGPRNQSIPSVIVVAIVDDDSSP